MITEKFLIKYSCYAESRGEKICVDLLDIYMEQKK